MRRLMFVLLVFLAGVGYVIYSLFNTLKFNIFKYKHLKEAKKKISTLNIV